MSESGPVTHLYRYAASSGLRRQEPVSGTARDVVSLATSGGVTETGPAAHPYFFTGFLTGPVVTSNAGPERVHPRLAGARELVAAGRVGLTEDGAMSGDHRVRFRPRGTGPDTCTCPWRAKHRGTRGPCQHVLAARIVLGQPGGAR